MECNRDEAIRAKTIADEKFNSKDFVSAKRFASKAQRLYPGLDGISQMLRTLDVYIFSEMKVSGEPDWYGVLDVKPSDDQKTIKKQYMKLALMLHPDKNRSVGADGAFKIINEAWGVLSDKTKRSTYDQERNSGGFQQNDSPQSGNSSTESPDVNKDNHQSANRATSKSENCNSNSTNQKGPDPVPCSVSTQAQSPPPTPTPTPVVHGGDIFWTICYRCKIPYVYLKIYHPFLCPNCHMPFLVAEMALPMNLNPLAPGPYTQMPVPSTFTQPTSYHAAIWPPMGPYPYYQYAQMGLYPYYPQMLTPMNYTPPTAQRATGWAEQQMQNSKSHGT